MSELADGDSVSLQACCPSSPYGIFAGSKGQRATVVFSPNAAQRVSRSQWHPMQRPRRSGDREFEIFVTYANEAELVLDVLGHAGPVSVKAPKSLRVAVNDQPWRAE